MPRTYLRRGDDGVSATELEAAFDALLTELDVPTAFAADVLAEAERAAADPDLPELDLTDLEFVTIDPPMSMDLDQAMCLQRHGSGFRVHYAIADVPAFVRAGSALDAETRRRGQTLYAPHRRVPLHPPALSEGAASLLPGELRPALVWVIDVADDGSPTAARVERARVRSRARFAYGDVQQAVEAGAPPPQFELLKPLGELLVAAEEARGGAALKVPDQEIEATENGYVLRYRPLVGVEQWNAQISLLTGRVAAHLMLDGRVGLLRTMPVPESSTVERLRRQALALEVPWPSGQGYAEWLRSLDPDDPKQLALCHESAVLFRGAGYTAFDGELPEQRLQAAVADSYAHVTAPLRRLVDRFGLAICEALCADREVPGWTREALASLPDVMKASDQASNALERAGVDLAEAAVLADRVGEEFDGVVVDLKSNKDGHPNGRGLVQLRDPAVLGPIEGVDELGARVRARLDTADVQTRTTAFSAV